MNLIVYAVCNNVDKAIIVLFVLIVITPADTGRLIINKTDVKNIDQQYRGKNRKELIIERLLDFNKVTIELIEREESSPNSECNIPIQLIPIYIPNILFVPKPSIEPNNDK